MSSPASRSYAWRLAALCLAMLLPSLGISIANVALPSLKAAFGASTQDVQWVVIAYLVALTSSLVAAGRLGDLLGRRRLLLGGIGLFALAGTAALFAADLWVLVLARAAQGLAAAVLMSLTIAMVGDLVPKERTGSAMGLLGTVSAIGTALGPSVGGLLIVGFGWPGVFGLMALAGALSLAFALHLLPPDEAVKTKRPPFDFVGALLLAISLATFALAMTIAAPTLVIGLLLGVSAAGLISFVRVETTTAAPLVQLSLLGQRGTSAGLISIALVSTIMMTTLVVGPFYLSGTLGLGPAATGLVMSIGPIVSALVGLPAGRLVDRFGPTVAVSSGLAGVLLGALSMALLAPALGVAGYVASLVFITAGYALFQAANNTAVMSSAGREQRGVASALLALARNLGLVLGASAMGALFVVGSHGLAMVNLAPGGEAGVRLTFLVAAALAGLALTAWRWGGRAPA